MSTEKIRKTGGNNVPLVGEQVYCLAGNTIDREPENGGNGIGYQENVAYTLTGFDRHAVFRRQRVDAFTTDEIACTQSARQSKDATDLILHTCELMGDKDLPILLIRRLTPLECERLQGFPDGWTDIPGASDSARYKALGNSVYWDKAIMLRRHSASQLCVRGRGRKRRSQARPSSQHQQSGQGVPHQCGGQRGEA